MRKRMTMQRMTKMNDNDLYTCSDCKTTFKLDTSHYSETSHCGAEFLCTNCHSNLISPAHFYNSDTATKNNNRR